MIPVVLLSLTLLGATAEERANYRAPRAGWTVAVGLGTGFPWGELSRSDGDFGFMFPMYVPLFVSAGKRFREDLYLGGYVQHGQSFMGCNCTGFDSGIGLDGEWHPLTGSHTDPFIGVRLGWEIARIAFESTPPLVGTYQGPEASLRLGFDQVWNRTLRYGFFVGASLSRFMVLSTHALAQGFEVIRYPGTHGWFYVGVRLAFGPLGGT